MQRYFYRVGQKSKSLSSNCQPTFAIRNNHVYLLAHPVYLRNLTVCERKLTFVLWQLHEMTWQWKLKLRQRNPSTPQLPTYRLKFQVQQIFQHSSQFFVRSIYQYTLFPRKRLGRPLGSLRGSLKTSSAYGERQLMAVSATMQLYSTGWSLVAGLYWSYFC